MAEFIVTDK